MSWITVTDLIREVHAGDDTLRGAWPFHYWGIEPLDEERPDWQLRYASVFQIGNAPSTSVAQTVRDAGIQEAGPEVIIALDAR